MKIAILSRNAQLYSTRRLAQAARLSGHQVQVVDTLSIPVNVGPTPGLAKDTILPDADAIIPRIGTSITFYGLAVVRQFESRQVITTASSEAIACSRDKLYSLQVMNRADLPTPTTTVVADQNDIGQAIDAAGGLPVIVKLIRGTQGRGVFLVSEYHTVESIWNTMHRLKEQMLIQEFISESRGSDLRAIIIGRRCVASMQRNAAAGEFRSNLHRGGTARPITLDRYTRGLAVRAAQAHGLSVAGVDIIDSARGPLLLEVNSSPGLEGIERATGSDVAREVVRFIEGEFKKRSRKRRQRHRRS
ncbi:MAG: RimK family alpha-L-glutamate ligase [Candidatus Promineifilaceae bacterium]|nr:RimK family alpha-L-glutamate ligase [Candidatus Promineifilaceae bacterium]